MLCRMLGICSIGVGVAVMQRWGGDGFKALCWVVGWTRASSNNLCG